jgi:hypothetical protein
MTDVLHRDADHPLIDADKSPETTADSGGGRSGVGTLHRIVVVGGGAGGLELVTRLGP